MDSAIHACRARYSRPPNTANLRTGEKPWYWKTVVKGVIYNNQEKQGFENQHRYGGGGGGGQQRGSIGGALYHHYQLLSSHHGLLLAHHDLAKCALINNWFSSRWLISPQYEWITAYFELHMCKIKIRVQNLRMCKYHVFPGGLGNN